MELNSIKIPDGYHAEIDNENGVINIVKNEKPKLAQSWEEYCAKTKRKGLFWVGSDGIVEDYSGNSEDNFLNPTEDRLTTTSKEKGEAIVALCQLMLLHEDWVGDWNPERADEEPDGFFYIYRWKQNVEVAHCDCDFYWLKFPTDELAMKFKNQFSDLLDKAKYLL